MFLSVPFSLSILACWRASSRWEIESWFKIYGMAKQAASFVITHVLLIPGISIWAGNGKSLNWHSQISSLSSQQTAWHWTSHTVESHFARRRPEKSARNLKLKSTFFIASANRSTRLGTIMRDWKICHWARSTLGINGNCDHVMRLLWCTRRSFTGPDSLPAYFKSHVSSYEPSICVM